MIRMESSGRERQKAKEGTSYYNKKLAGTYVTHILQWGAGMTYSIITGI